MAAKASAKKVKGEDDPSPRDSTPQKGLKNQGNAAAALTKPESLTLSALFFITIPVVVAVAAAYFGGFLGVGGKRAVPAAHHRASQPNTKAAPKGQSNAAVMAAALNKSSPWLVDSEIDAASGAVSCGFRVIEAGDLRPEMFQEGSELERVPLLVRGFTSKWPAHEKWERSQFIELFGNKTIMVDSESSIVYGGGTATKPMKVGSFLASMRRPSAVMPDAFTFDVSVLQSIPELTSDYRVPLPFKSWDNTESHSANHVWHMLSLGPSRTGLPFHSHGKTWLALIHGSKRWLVYPPGYNAPAEIQQQFNPLLSNYVWMQNVYPKLASLPPAPVDPSADTASTSPYSRPLECVQRPGDIIYLPEGWAHMTINIGEAVGIGGQSSMNIDDRLSVGLKAVARNADNFDGHKFAALALAHKALEEEHRFKSQLVATSAGLVQLRADNFEEMVLAGEDTWLVRFELVDEGEDEDEGRGGGGGGGVGIHPKQNSVPLLPETTKAWNAAAGKLKGLVSVGAMNVTRAWAPSLAAEIVASRDQTGRGWVAKVLLGNGNRKAVDACLAEAILFNPTPTTAPSAGADAGAGAVAEGERESEGEGVKVAASGEASSDDLVDFAISSTALGGGQQTGSAVAVTAKGKRLFAEAEVHQRRCLELQPLHPEGHGLLAELLGHAGLRQSMGQAIEAAEALYDELDPEQGSPHSLAAVYHKLATVYLGVSQRGFPGLGRTGPCGMYVGAFNWQVREGFEPVSTGPF